MTSNRDAASRRFRDFRTTILTLARSELDHRFAEVTDDYLGTIEALIENYLASIPSLREMMMPRTFLLGASVIATDHVLHASLDFNMAETVNLGFTPRAHRVAGRIQEIVCHGDHEWAGLFCSRCFSRRAISPNKGGGPSWRYFLAT